MVVSRLNINLVQSTETDGYSVKLDGNSDVKSALSRDCKLSKSAKCEWVFFWWKKKFWQRAYIVFVVFHYYWFYCLFTSNDYQIHKWFFFFFNLVFGKTKKVNTASEILYFYICWFYFAFLFFIRHLVWMSLNGVFFFLLRFVWFHMSWECGDKGISVFLNC